MTAKKVDSSYGFDIKKDDDGFYVYDGDVKLSGPHATKNIAESEAKREHERRHPTPKFDPF